MLPASVMHCANGFDRAPRIGRRLRARALFLTFCSQYALACSSSPEASRGAPGGQSNLAARILGTAAGSGIFWFNYVAPPPAGRSLQVSVATGVTAPCSLFQGSTKEEPASALNIVLGDAEHGPHEIAPHPSGPMSASVSWVEAPATKSKVRAISGSVDYVDGPSDEPSWKDGGTAVVRVTADFEADPIVAAVCGGSDDASEGIALGCDCKTRSGNTFRCDGNDCCDDQGQGTAEHVEFEVDAEACAAACSYTDPAFSEYCPGLE